MKAGMRHEVTCNSKSRGAFGGVFCAMLFALSTTAEGQQSAKIPRIGFLSSSSPATFSIYTGAFRRGLRDLGYEEGKTIMIEYRYAAGILDQLPILAGELVGLKVDVIVAAGGLTLVNAGADPSVVCRHPKSYCRACYQASATDDISAAGSGGCRDSDGLRSRYAGALLPCGNLRR